jgi:hypothetical protein
MMLSCKLLFGNNKNLSYVIKEAQGGRFGFGVYI